MRKLMAILLAALMLSGLFTACADQQPVTTQPQPKTTVPATGSGYMDDVFENDETISTEPQVPESTGSTQSTETQPATTQPAESQSVATQPTNGTEPKPTTGPDTPTTQPTEGQQPATQPTDAPTQPSEEATAATEATTPESTEASTEPTLDAETLALAKEYEAYTAMNGSEKTAFRNTFANMDDFFTWYNAAMAAYKLANPPTKIPPDGNIDLG